MKGDVHIISLVVLSSFRKNEDGGERTLMMIMLEHRQSKLHQSLSPPSSFIYIKPACFHSVSASATSSLSSSPPPILSNCHFHPHRHLNHLEISVFFTKKNYTFCSHWIPKCNFLSICKPYLLQIHILPYFKSFVIIGGRGGGSRLCKGFHDGHDLCVN